jgi:hypothetical protein
MTAGATAGVASTWMYRRRTRNTVTGAHCPPRLVSWPSAVSETAIARRERPALRSATMRLTVLISFATSRMPRRPSPSRSSVRSQPERGASELHALSFEMRQGLACSLASGLTFPLSDRG